MARWNRNNNVKTEQSDEFRGLKIKDEVLHIYGGNERSTVERFEDPFIYVRDQQGALKNKLRPMLREELILVEQPGEIDEFPELSSQTW
jgi:hypothetical protein